MQPHHQRTSSAHRPHGCKHVGRRRRRLVRVQACDEAIQGRVVAECRSRCCNPADTRLAKDSGRRRRQRRRQWRQRRRPSIPSSCGAPCCCCGASMVMPRRPVALPARRASREAEALRSIAVGRLAVRSQVLRCTARLHNPRGARVSPIVLGRGAEGKCRPGCAGWRRLDCIPRRCLSTVYDPQPIASARETKADGRWLTSVSRCRLGAPCPCFARWVRRAC